MNRHGPVLLLGFVLAVFIAGLAVLFRLRLGQGDIFPAYSSLRSDPLGTLALHDGLAQLPGMRVERNFQSLVSLPLDPPRTILLAGLAEEELSSLPTEQFSALDAAVRAGSRVVIALRARIGVRGEVPEKAGGKPAEKPSPKKTGGKKPEEAKPEDVAAISYADLHRWWGVEVLDRELRARGDGATLVAGTPEALPARVDWRSDLHFKLVPTAGWRVLYRRAGEPVLVERSRGHGSIVLAGDAYFLSNEALQTDRPTALLVWTIGPNSRVLFDEGHLGVVADPGVMALAQRYGLLGAFFMLLLLAALFVWRRMALFVPPAEEARELTLAYHPAAGLEALLRRALPPDELVPVGVAEWTRTARPEDKARATAALAGALPNISAVDRYNLVVRALRRRRSSSL